MAERPSTPTRNASTGSPAAFPSAVTSSPTGSLRRKDSGLSRARQRVSSLTSSFRNSLHLSNSASSEEAMSSSAASGGGNGGGSPAGTPSRNKLKRAFSSRFAGGRGSGRGAIQPLADEKPLVVLRVQVMACSDLPAMDANGKSDA
jgi:hypothetical protein